MEPILSQYANIQFVEEILAVKGFFTLNRLLGSQFGQEIYNNESQIDGTGLQIRIIVIEFSLCLIIIII